MPHSTTVEYRGKALITDSDMKDVRETIGAIAYNDDGSVDVVPSQLEAATFFAKSIVINTPEGSFSHTREVDDATPISLFHTNHDRPVSRWTMPLVNFIPDKDEPPRTIEFLFNGQAGRIEMLPGYAARVGLLHEGRARSVATAVMIGEIGTDIPDVEELSRWFPYVFLHP